jgi:hypothetical protein
MCDGRCTAGLDRPAAFPLGGGRRLGYNTRCSNGSVVHVDGPWGHGDLCQEHYENWLILCKNPGDGARTGPLEVACSNCVWRCDHGTKWDGFFVRPAGFVETEPFVDLEAGA